MGRWGRSSLFMNQLTRTTEHISPAPNFVFHSFCSNYNFKIFKFRAFSAVPSRAPSFGFLHNSPSFSSNPNFKILNLRLFSAVPFPALSYTDEYDITQNYVFDSYDDENVKKIPVKAYFLSTSINLKSMQAENLSNIVPSTSRSTKFIVLRYCDFPSKITRHDFEEDTSSWSYMVVFHYGSVVLFNIEDDEVESYLDIVRYYSLGLLPEMKKDDYAVKEDPLLVNDMQGGPDYIVLKKLDSDAIRIIGSVLGQSIALDHFVSQVDSMVEEFTDINREMEKTGNFTMERKKLFQLVGRANSNLADVILKVGIFERSEIAWRDAKYAQIFEYLREEYEVSQCFGNLDFKLKFVEHNIHFLQEVLQNRKSDLLEWCIIFLLTIENIISLSEILRETNVVL